MSGSVKLGGETDAVALSSDTSTNLHFKTWREVVTRDTANNGATTNSSPSIPHYQNAVLRYGTDDSRLASARLQNGRFERRL